MNAGNGSDVSFQNSLEAAGYARTTRVGSFVIVNIAAGRQRPADIARNLGVSRQAISQINKAFAQRGWIETLPDHSHGKEQIVTFSEACTERYDLLGHIIKGLVQEITQHNEIATVKALKITITRADRASVG